MAARLIFLEVLLGIAWYNVAAIWLMEVEIFRSWQLMDKASFQRVRAAHWRKLPGLVFVPLGITFVGVVLLIWFHPIGTPGWMIWTGLGLQLAAWVLTAMFWGRWQARITYEDIEPSDPLVSRLINTHWVRTLLVTLYGILLFWMTVEVVLRRF